MLSTAQASGTPVNHRRVKLHLYTLIALTALAFVLGGGARDDIVSLIVLRPLSAMIFVVAIFSAGAAALRRSRVLVGLAFATFGLVLAHLIPMPPGLWTLLPGREPIVEVFQAAGMDLPWQPISMTPDRTWNALFALMVPIAALLLAVSLDGRSLSKVLKLVLAIGLLSALLGLFQILGPGDGPLYFYRITNEGSPVGLFANRNHQAVFLACLLPLLGAAVATAKNKERLFGRLALITAGFIMALILVTGSRAGMAAAVLAVPLSWWVYRAGTADERPGRAVWQLIALVAGATVLIGITIAASRAKGWDRLQAMDSEEELRFQALDPIWQGSMDVFPVGSGVGSFVEYYKLIEPQALLSSHYLNHAHNDFIEALMTGGLPAVLLILWAIALSVRAAVAVSESHPDLRFPLVLGRAGIGVLLLLGMASFVDYPLRVPSLSLLGGIAAACAAYGYASVRSYRLANRPNGNHLPLPALNRAEDRVSI